MLFSTTSPRLAALLLTALLYTPLAAPFFTPSLSAQTPVVGFAQAIDDKTIDDARRGFLEALKNAGFENGKNFQLNYQNALGDTAALNRLMDRFIADKVNVIVANTTLSMLAAVQKTNTIPICMLVAPRPDLAGISPPLNLTGVYETLGYIDTSAALIKRLFPKAKRVGTIVNSEANAQAALKRVRDVCRKAGIELIELSESSSSTDVSRLCDALLATQIDVFFALPNNIMFFEFATVEKKMTAKRVPILSSETGLVTRGAVAAYGADIYEWGKQAGRLTAKLLKGEKPPLEEVKVREFFYNLEAAKALGITLPAEMMKGK